MNCDRLLECLEGLLHGGLAESDHADALAHIDACGDCRGLFAALVAATQAPADPDLSQAILARTSGTTCDSAQARLPARIDGELDAVELELLNGHLMRCEECAGLARILAQVQQDLPRLAQVDPGERFVEAVLARTTRRYRFDEMAAPVSTFLSRLFHRRRIAWEGAFVATVFLVAPVAAPGSPFAGLPGQALGLVREAPAQPALAIDRLRVELNDPDSPVVRGASTAWSSTGAAVLRSSNSVWSSLTRNSGGSWSAIRRSFGTFLGTFLGTFIDTAASGQTSGTTDPGPEAAAHEQENRR